jgi:alanyl-tRNA synthetase
VSRSGEIGMIKVVSEEGIASGVRRIRAITGDCVLDRIRDQEAFLLQLRNEIGEDPVEGIRRLRDELRCARERLESMAAAEVKDVASELIETAEEIGSARLIGGRVDLSGDQLKNLADTLEARARPAVVLLVGNAGGGGIAVCKRSKGFDAIDAGAVIRTVSGVLGGGGGGGKAFAQGGGPQVEKLDEALAAGQEALRDALS